MDNYYKECEACWCEKAQEMRYGYDMWFNCRSCPFAECYEPDTREQYLAGVTEREAEYKRFEEAQKLRMMEEQEYKRSTNHQEQKDFAESIKRKVKKNVLLTPEEFERSLAFHYLRDSDYLDFFSVEELVRYQLSALGYEGAAEELASYIESMRDY